MAKKGPNIVFGLSREMYSDQSAAPTLLLSETNSTSADPEPRSSTSDAGVSPSHSAAGQTWGPAARGALSDGYSAITYPWIAKVLKQIDAELLDIGQDDQSRVALGVETRLANGYLKRQLASPWIFSLDALNTFCEYNWRNYSRVQATDVWPKVWFWVNEPAKNGQPRRGDSFAERGMLPK